MIDILYSGYNYTHKNGIRFDTKAGHAGFECWLLVFFFTLSGKKSNNKESDRGYSFHGNTLYAF